MEIINKKLSNLQNVNKNINITSSNMKEVKEFLKKN